MVDTLTLSKTQSRRKIERKNAIVDVKRGKGIERTNETRSNNKTNNLPLLYLQPSPPLLDPYWGAHPPPL